MSYSETFLTLYPYICFFLMNAAIIAVLLIPNKYCNTSSINKTKIVVALVVGGLHGLSGDHYLSLLIFATLAIGIARHFVREQKRKFGNMIQQTNAPDFIKRIK